MTSQDVKFLKSLRIKVDDEKKLAVPDLTGVPQRPSGVLTFDFAWGRHTPPRRSQPSCKRASNLRGNS